MVLAQWEVADCNRWRLLGCAQRHVCVAIIVSARSDDSITCNLKKACCLHYTTAYTSFSGMLIAMGLPSPCCGAGSVSQTNLQYFTPRRPTSQRRVLRRHLGLRGALFKSESTSQDLAPFLNQVHGVNFESFNRLGPASALEMNLMPPKFVCVSPFDKALHVSHNKLWRNCLHALRGNFSKHRLAPSIKVLELSLGLFCLKAASGTAALHQSSLNETNGSVYQKPVLGRLPSSHLSTKKVWDSAPFATGFMGSCPTAQRHVCICPVVREANKSVLFYEQWHSTRYLYMRPLLPADHVR